MKKKKPLTDNLDLLSALHDLNASTAEQEVLN